MQFSGLMHPVSSLEGAALDRRDLSPHLHARHQPGVFSKALGLHDLIRYA